MAWLLASIAKRGASFIATVTLAWTLLPSQGNRRLFGAHPGDAMKIKILVTCLSAALLTSTAFANEPSKTLPATDQTTKTTGPDYEAAKATGTDHGTTRATGSDYSTTSATGSENDARNAARNEYGTTGTAIGFGSATTMTTNANANANAEAIAVLTAVNDHELKSAEMALEKNPSAAVAEYAQMLHDQHANNQDETLAVAADAVVISDEDSPAVDALMERNKAKREELSALQGDAFETAFIDAMVQDHTEVLAKIDNELIPHATDSEVSRHLRETRVHVAKHLEEARKLEVSLQASR